MQKKIQIKILPSEAGSDQLIKKELALAACCPEKNITGFHLLKRSVDARSRQPHILLTADVFIQEPYHPREMIRQPIRDISRSTKTVLIAGAGPAGLFAALKLIHAGIRPIILERGKDVRARRRDLASLNKEGIINPESNYCFGEGGAGTYSDGKLYTRSNKRGNIHHILDLFVQFGAEESILYEAHPHIGTNKLPQIITAIRSFIIACGGELHFEKKLSGWTSSTDRILEVHTADGAAYPADALILATGHSARDIFQLLHRKKIQIEAKPFALGVRVEHPQELINAIQYHLTGNTRAQDLQLPPASYQLVSEISPKSVFSFCMCPGGIIAPAATADGEVVLNGWSPSKRNNPYANSGIVVNIENSDWRSFEKHGALAAMYFQSAIEQQAFKAGGGRFKAPAQRMTDFVNNKISASLPACSYVPGLTSAAVADVFPSLLGKILRKGFSELGKKMKGYYTEEAVIVATESRTSSPVRIPRDPQTLTHPQLKNLFPCGEGAGYAGGIVSAAMDGERVAEMIARIFSPKQILHADA
ncbi:MAG: FAD-dependent monooxygenase [Bacteroidota bacterium]|nr:FAD-dependent monooxygenase [Bacteroidota bacterium]MDP4211215.1 FAD-dependent monooxygenase [Bacteroidota bacterium]MDP4251123.1 FAD-dependent monooxygenase [Bacteroidota bacterium]